MKAKVIKKLNKLLWIHHKCQKIKMLVNSMIKVIIIWNKASNESKQNIYK